MKLFLSVSLLLLAHIWTFGQCTIDTAIQTPGFHPDTGSYLPKACLGSNYDATIQIYAPQNVTIALGNFPVNYVQLDSIPALPANMSYSTNPVGGKMNGGERGCINIYGLVNVPAGDYTFTIYYTANFTAFGAPVSLGFLAPYKLHVDTGSATYSSIADTVCEYPGYNLGGKWLTASGTYIDTMMASSGCDSIVTLQLSVTPFNLTVTPIGNALHAVAGMESYQWYDCDAQAIISDETNSIYTPLATGIYAVMISNGACSGTSACFSYTGLKEADEPGICVYPNPFTQSIYVSIPPKFINETLLLMSIDGKQIHKQKLYNLSNKIDIQELPSGVYYLSLVNNTKCMIKRITKW